MAAVAYESYTDYGEWPMSAAFSTDWVRASAPGQQQQFCVYLKTVRFVPVTLILNH